MDKQLLNDLLEAIAAARWQAVHAGSITRRNHWDDVKARLLQDATNEVIAPEFSRADAAS